MPAHDFPAKPLPSVSIPGKHIAFTYTDSGAPNTQNYTTLILVHGHTWHSGVFKKLAPLAATHSVRIICINRREYPGSTEHTDEELEVYRVGSLEERKTLMQEEGLNLALCVNGIIQQCALPPNVALAGWSLGNTFTLAAMASIPSLPSDVQEKLKSHLQTFILWEPPSEALGIKSPPKQYVPLYDTNIDPAQRGRVFGQWVTSFFKHDLSVPHDADKKLKYKLEEALEEPKPTFHDMPFPELETITNFAAGGKCDTILIEPPFQPVVDEIIKTALFTPKIREAWGNPKVAYMYGEANTWNVLWAVWDIEERVQNAGGKAPITFRPIAEANHFVRLL
ncbi:hypothetical protein DFH09DRAFT_913244 [Mycena vulgaris]|nr:hypothetical protein DFH09DRAFT_913244 [Mycena vulgaris]